jgi:hypothetical protein
MMGLFHLHLKSGCQSANMTATYMSTTSGAHLPRQPLCIFIHLSRRSSSPELIAVPRAHLLRQPLQQLHFESDQAHGHLATRCARRTHIYVVMRCPLDLLSYSIATILFS